MRQGTRIAIFSALIALAAVTALPGVGNAAKLTDYNVIINLEFGYHQGEVTSISPKGDYFAVNGATMFLVECTSSGGVNLTTSFYNSYGDPITFHDLKVGDSVLVYGGALRADTRAAKDVFVTSGYLKGSQRKAFLAGKKMQTWRKDLKIK